MVLKVEYDPNSTEYDQKLQVFQNKVFRHIYGLKHDKMTGEWRGPHNYELHDSPDIIRIMKSRRLKGEATQDLG